MERFLTDTATIEFDDALIADKAAVADALRRVGDEGAAALSLLPPAALKPLLIEALDLHYTPARPVVGKGEAAVYQDFRLTTDLPPDGALMRFSRALERLINESLSYMRRPPLAGRFEINDYIVQHYPAGCAGMSPHRDHIRYTGLVAIVVLGGAGRFTICDDRAGANEREIPTRPGDLLLMRAPGFQGRGDRPFHAVRDITDNRYIIGLRHDSRPDRWDEQEGA